MTSFKLDENLPSEACQLLVNAGFDAVTVFDQALHGKPDVEVARVCREEGRVLVTLDLDFANVRAFDPTAQAGIIVLRPARQSRGAVVRVLDRALALLKSEAVAGHLWIVGDDRIRIWPSR